MIEIPVELDARRYDIAVGEGALRALPKAVAALRRRRLQVVSSPRVWRLHGRRLRAVLGRVPPPLLVPDGERHKSRAWLARLHDGFLASGLGRDGLVLAFGGGVVGDLAGFAAATYMRGIDWVGVPTTLLAMVDSSIGGKVGINHPQAKNLIGAFHQPRAVVSDLDLLTTLPRRERQSGAYEVLKCALIADASLFAAFQEAPPALEGWDQAERAVAAACRIKAEVVGADEMEGSRRRVLNLGHTIGHGLEAVTGYRRFTHGEAVGWGLIGAAALAHDRGLLESEDFTTVAAAVDRLGPRPRMSDLPARAILDALGRDKKGRGTFILPDGIGRVVIHDDVTPAEVRKALRVMAARERA